MNIRQPIKFCVTNVNLMTEYTRNGSFCSRDTVPRFRDGRTWFKHILLSIVQTNIIHNRIIADWKKGRT